METTFSAPQISCEGCAGAIKRALGAVPGVSAVTVDVAAKTVRVTHDDDAEREALAAVLAEAGYPPTEPVDGEIHTSHHGPSGDMSLADAGRMVKDPVCGMTIDPSSAMGKS